MTLKKSYNPFFFVTLHSSSIAIGQERKMAKSMLAIAIFDA